MTELLPSSWYQRRRLQRPRFPAWAHLYVSICLVIIGLGFAVTSVPEFQASIGDGTLGTYTVTGFTDDPHHDVLGTFISANRQVVVKNRAYIGNPRLNLGTTVPAIVPSWGWLRFGDGSVYGPGRDPTALPLLVFSGVLAPAAVASLTWSIRRLRRLRRARRTFPIATMRRT